MTSGKKAPAKIPPGTTATGHSMRRAAEEHLARSGKKTPGQPLQTTDELVHELQVHQIELEMQNEALREAQLALEESRDKYLDLYEFAPLGYLTLNDTALVTAVNLTGALLLGRERNTLVRARFSKFIAAADADTWHRFFLNVLNQSERQTCVLTLERKDGSVFPARLEGIRITSRDGKTTTARIALSDITDIRKTENALLASEKNYRTLFENMLEGFAYCRMIYDEKGRPVDWEYLAVNKEFGKLTGLQNITGKRVLEAIPDIRDQNPELFDIYGRVSSTGRAETFEIDFKPLKMWLKVSVFSPGKGYFVAVFHDVTRRRQTDTFRQLSVDVLTLLNDPANLPDVVRRVLGAIKLATNADAIGIRLKAGDDFPYFVHQGFSEEFLQKENSLADRDQFPGMCRDAGGRVSLECTCGLVISGKTDPENTLFSPGGSAWTNNSYALLDLPKTDDPRYHPRNTCIHMGYGSVAIIPVRASPRHIIGTLQVNAVRKDCFNPEIIESLELIAGQIGVILMRKRAETALHQALAEKGVLLAEVHHRVKNNLQIISALIDLTRMNAPDPATAGILTDMLLKIKTMAQIHTRLYESKEFARINIGGHIRDQVVDLSDVYLNSGHKILYTINAEDICLPVEQAIPLGLIINEVLSNAHKHAFRGRESGNIAVSVRQENGNIIVRIEDDGAGVPEGVDIDRSTSLGLKLIRSLTQQLRGTLAISSSPRGFRVDVTFPLMKGDS